MDLGIGIKKNNSGLYSGVKNVPDPGSRTLTLSDTEFSFKTRMKKIGSKIVGLYQTLIDPVSEDLLNFGGSRNPDP